VPVLRGRSLVGLVTAGLVLAWGPAPTRAADADWLTRRGAFGAACDGDRLAASVSAHLGRDAGAAAGEARLRVTLADGGPAPGVVELTFADTEGRSIGRRVFSFDDSSCQDALEAVAVAVALFLQDRVAPAEGAAPEPPATDPPRAAPPASPPALLAARAEAPPPPQPAPAWSAGVRAGALVGGGDMPWGVWGAEATVRARRKDGGWPELFAGGVFLPRQQATTAGVHTSWMRAGGRAGLCPFSRGWGSRQVAACAAVTLGRLTVDSADLSPSYRQDRWAAGADGALALAQRLYGGWALGLEARLVIPFLRDRVQAADSAGTTHDLFRASPVGAAGLISIGYSWAPPGR